MPALIKFYRQHFVTTDALNNSFSPEIVCARPAGVQNDFSSCPSAPSDGDKGVLSRSFHTSISAGNGAKRTVFLPQLDLPKMKDFVATDKMEAICKNCQYFETRDNMFGINTWGLCIRFKGENTADRRKISFIRWVDYTCPDFKAREELNDSQSRRD
jgi:hypothetical protein